jgi:hypothetical protein
MTDRDAQSHITVTAWPAVPIEMPAVWRPDLVDIGDGYVLVQRSVTDGGDDPETGRPRLPWIEEGLRDEVYLREARDIDLDDDAALFAFAHDFGWPTDGDGADHLPDDPMHELDVVRATFGDDATGPPARWGKLAKVEATGRIMVCRHLGEVRFRLRLIRDLTRLWLIVSGQKDADSRGGDLLHPQTMDDAASILERFVNSALADLTVGLQLVRTDIVDKKHQLQPGLLTSYSAMVLQLRNDIAGGSPYLVCANENCRRLFLRQRSTDPLTVTRPNRVRFCSASCRDAQRQREYRRKQNAKQREVQP